MDNNDNAKWSKVMDALKNQSVQEEAIDGHSSSNQGPLRLSRYILIGWIILGVSIKLSFVLTNGLTDRPFYWLIVGLALVVLIGWSLWVIQHLILRSLLFAYNDTPFNYGRFLDYAVALIFLRSVGGGYRFTHRLLMGHIAALSDAEIEALTRDLS